MKMTEKFVKKEEEKEHILNELKSLSSKMVKIEINLNEKVDDETATNPVKVINLDFFMTNSRTLTELVDSFVELEQNNDQMFLYCVVCNPPDTNKGTAATNRPGVFFYNDDLAGF